ncbi:MAG: winged helix-turn-helix domain-containing protein [Bryobacteraceae bacterium]|nr:winged helix-turn-helix domain-containing protein [Bryobacteraceae bacterium]
MMTTTTTTKHTANTVPQVYRDEHLSIDSSHRAVVLDREQVVLTRKEYQLLTMLAANAGRVMPRDYLLEKIWNYSKGIRTRTLDVHVLRLRRKLGSTGSRYIETVFGVGYRFRASHEQAFFRHLHPAFAATF